MAALSAQKAQGKNPGKALLKACDTHSTQLGQYLPSFSFNYHFPGG